MHAIIRNTIGIASAAACGLVTLAAAPDAWAQQGAAQQIVGVWRLVSAVNVAPDGTSRPGSFGPTPKGQIIFTASGHYTSVTTHSELPKFASGNRLQGTAEENKAIVQGSNSSFGTYSVSPDGKILLFKIEGGAWPHWHGTEQKRNLTISGDDMAYALDSSRGGRSTLTWKRVK